MLKSIIYVSSATDSLSKDALLDILNKSSVNNTALGLTGMLLYYDESFIQVLEGDEDKLELLMNKISQDKRHKNVVVINEEYISQREFSSWDMGFRSIDKEQMGAIKGYVDMDSLNLSKDGAKGLLKVFYDLNVKSNAKIQF